MLFARVFRIEQGDLPGKLIYKVVDSEKGTAIGHIELAAIDRRNGSAHLCRVLVGNTAYRGRGLGPGTE